MNKKSPFFSICIPTYEMKGHGSEYLLQSFKMFESQTFTDFEVIVSDHSTNDDIQKLCERFEQKFQITYLRNYQYLGNSSANVNNAIRAARGKWIKILFQDDYFYSVDTLQMHANALVKKENVWLACGTEHYSKEKGLFNPHLPSYHSKIYLGVNTIGAPSNITFPNDPNPELFDVNLIWLMDCEFYKRLEYRYGIPILLQEILIVNRIGDHQITQNLIHKKLVRKEERYVQWKNLKLKLFGWIG